MIWAQEGSMAMAESSNSGHIMAGAERIRHRALIEVSPHQLFLLLFCYRLKIHTPGKEPKCLSLGNTKPTSA